MALTNVNNSHIGAFNQLTLDGAKQATREIFDKVIVAPQVPIEPQRFMNTYIVSNDYTGGMNTSYEFNSVNYSNPAGTYRTAVQPRATSLEDFSPVKNLGDINFNQNAVDQIVLAIDKPLQTPITTVYPMDEKWLYSDLETAISLNVVNTIASNINYGVYPLFADGALTTADSFHGFAPNISYDVANSAAGTASSNNLINDFAKYTAKPEDRYVFGFEDSEIVGIIDPSYRAKLLIEKLVIWDGATFGSLGAWYEGLPGYYQFAGHPLIVSKFINAPGTPSTKKVGYIITPIGRFAPLLFHLAAYQVHADIIPFSGKALGIYGITLYGAKIAEIFKQYITIGYIATKNSTISSPFGADNIEGVTIQDITNNSFKLACLITYGTATGWAYRVSRIDDANHSNGAWKLMADAGGAEVPITKDYLNGNLSPQTEYRVEVALTDGTNPISVVYKGVSYTELVTKYTWTAK